MKTAKNQPATWGQVFRNAFTRHWKEKLVALVIAFFFWNMVKQQIHRDYNKQRDFIEQHTLKGATEL